MPRRRALLAAATAVAVTLVGGGVAVVGGWPDAGSPVAHASAGPSTRSSPATRPPRAPGPVLLVPGYGGSLASLAPLADALRASGREVVLVPMPGQALGDLTGQARALDAAVRQQIRAGASSVDLIGYSAGGVVAHLWQQTMDVERLARRVVTLGSPHAGTSVAQLALTIAPDQCPLACQQLVPGSALLRSLGTRVGGDGASWTAIWSADDGVVQPPRSGVLAGAVDVQLQAVCPDARTTHGQLPRDPLVIGLVLRALDAQGTAIPTPGGRVSGAAQCAALRAAGGVARHRG